MSRKKLLKKWGTYALGVMAMTGGMVATNVIKDNAIQVSAEESYKNLYSLTNDFNQNWANTGSFSVITDEELNAVSFDVSIMLKSDFTHNLSEFYFLNIDEVDFSNLTYDDIVIKNTSTSGTGKVVSFTIVLYSYNGNIYDFISNSDVANKVYDVVDFLLQNEPKGAYTDTYYYNNVGIRLLYAEDTGDIFAPRVLDMNGYGYHQFDDFERDTTKSLNFVKVQIPSSLNVYIEEDLIKAREQGFEQGAESVDITSDNESAINQYITDNNMKTEEEYNSYGESQYQAGAESVDITTDNESAINQYIEDNNMKTEEEYNSYGESQYQAGAESVDITTDNESAINQYIEDNNMKTEEEYNSYGESQYQAGAESVDITSDNESAINQYIEDNNMKTEEEYNSYGESQYQAGAESVDITADNENAINQYIEDNNMKTEEEYNSYGESQYQAGAESVDITADNESAINQYITDNNMKTEEEYNAHGESQYQAGAESVDITTDNESAINQYIEDNNMKTEEEYNSYGESQYQAGAESVDITSDNEQSYNSGFQDAMDSFGKTEDSEGKYMYMFEMADRHGSVDTKSIIINEEQGKSNVLKTTLFLNINNNSGIVNHYGDSSYLINIDEVLDFDNLRYSDIVRYGNEIVEDTGYVFSYSDVIFYSPSGKLVSFINNVDLENLSKQIMELIKVNELAELNEDMTNMRVTFSHTALDYFGNFVSIEQNYEGQEFVNVSSNGSIGIHVNSGRNLDFSVIRRSYDDVMYGVYGNGYSHDQYLEYGEEQFNAGAESVDITTDNESAINQYIEDNNMKTEEEYNSYGQVRFEEGKEESANEYAERLEVLDSTIDNLNREVEELNSKLNDMETTDDKYQLGYSNGFSAGESSGYEKGFEEALSKDLEEYGEEQYNLGYNSGFNSGYSEGYSTAENEKDKVIEDVEQEKEDLVGQVESLQKDIDNLNGQIDSLTGTISNLNGMLDVKYNEGFEDGAESVDITSDNEEIYNQGYNDGYAQCEIDNPPSITFPENTYEFGFKDGYQNGYAEGVESVDITVDNENAINQYIEDNNMKTEEEYNDYGKLNYDTGYKDNNFGNQIKRVGKSVGTLFANIGKGIVQYVAFGWLWDKSGKFIPKF